ncbi:imidazole glycerol phosphate synthase subunit HisH [Priestia filamentosa]|uniref:imidazole glycerol phosphate synthase subunit HisH n=1 Tax=Priestia filamentosa TaxID=1402861 RepID=UPI0002D3540E|nr:imidazole glycerol phosphate synthase subunit HisH [Priestia filamentosa]
MIGIIDYGMGNLYSVSKALERLDYDYIISNDPKELKKTKGYILPGVGAFGDAMEELNRQNLAFFIKEEADRGKPLLGICLGMQLLFEQSEENGISDGLGLLKGRVIKFKGTTAEGESYKVPHMGWNKLTFNRDSELLTNVEEEHVYFVHSYYVDTDDKEAVIATADYDVKVPAVVGRDNVFGTQFHPEKSSDIGVKMLRNFANYVEKRGEGSE